jgi:hypothetical protein
MLVGCSTLPDHVYKLKSVIAGDRFVFRQLDHLEMNQIDNSVDGCCHPFAGLFDFCLTGFAGLLGLLSLLASPSIRISH